MTMSLTVTGAEKVREKVTRMARWYPEIAAKALNEFAELTMTAAVKMTPIDTGRLRQSARVTHATPKRLQATLSYDTPYALVVHETPPPPASPSARHQPPYGRGGQWKYLETPINRRSKKFAEAIAKSIARELKAKSL